MNVIDAAALGALLRTPVPSTLGTAKVQSILAGRQRLVVRPPNPENIDMGTEDLVDKIEDARLVDAGGFSFEFEEMRSLDYTRVFVSSRSPVAFESLHSFTDAQTSGLAHALASVASAFVGSGLRFETAEGTYRKANIWHSHVEAPSMHYLGAVACDDANTLEAMPSAQFVYAAKHGAIKRGAFVELCDAPGPDAYSRLKVIEGPGSNIFIARESDGFVFDLAKARKELIYWFHHRKENQQWQKMPCEGDSEYVLFHIRSVLRTHPLYFKSTRSQANDSHIRLECTEDVKQAAKFTIDAEGCLCIVDGADVKPLYAAERYKYVPNEPPPSPYGNDKRDLVRFTNDTVFKGGRDVARENYIKSHAIAFAAALQSQIPGDLLTFVFHSVLPIVAFTFRDIDDEEPLLNVHSIERLLTLFQQLLITLFDNAVLNEQHKNRIIGCTATMNLDSSTYLPGVEDSRGAVPGLTAAAAAGPLPSSPDTMEVLRRARGYILLDPRVMYCVVKEIDGLSAAETWKENYCQHGDVSLNY